MANSVHPQAQQLLDGKAASGAPPLWELSPDEARAGVDANGAIIPAGPELESVRDIVIPSQAGGMPARVYSPSAGRARARRLLPRRRLGGRVARRVGLLGARPRGRVRVRRGERGLPARARARLPRGRRRRVRRAGVGRLGVRARAAGGRRGRGRQRGRQPRGRVRAAGAGLRRAADRPAGAGLPGHRLRPEPAVLPGVRRGRAHPEPARHGLVLGPLRARPGRAGEPVRLAAARVRAWRGCRPRTW